MRTHFSWVYFVTIPIQVKHCSVSKPKAQSLWHCCLKGIIYSLLMSSFSSSFFDMESRRTSASFMCSGIMRLGFSAGVLTRGGGGGGRYDSFFFLGLSLACGIINQQTNIDLKNVIIMTETKFKAQNKGHTEFCLFVYICPELIPCGWTGRWNSGTNSFSVYMHI